MSKGKEETYSGYSFRYMPGSFKDRAKKLAKVETELNRAEGKGMKTMEALLIELIGEGLDRREKKRGIK